MLAAQINGPNRCTLVDIPLREPEPYELRIKLEGCGLCSSSMPLWEGRRWFKYPLDPGAPGHEGWGLVEAAGAAVSMFKPGDRAAILSNNAFAECDFVPESKAVRLPANLDETPFPGEALGCALNIFHRSHIQPGQIVAIVGIGFLGALLIQLCKSQDVTVIAISRSIAALRLAKRFGAQYVFALEQDPVSQVMALTNGKGCARVIEATGLQTTLDLASDLIAEGGKLIIAGYHQDGDRRVNLRLWNWRGIDVINAHERDPARRRGGMQRAIDAAIKGDIDYLPLLTHRFPLSRLDDAFDILRQRPPGFVKVLIVPNNA